MTQQEALPFAVADPQRQLTDLKRPCPTCGTPLVGARAWNSEAQEMFYALACRVCDQLYELGST